MSTKIPWVRNPDGSPGEVWNPIIGCTPASPGCDNCWAERLHTQRHEATYTAQLQPPCYKRPFNKVRFREDRLDYPLHWKKPRTIFVNSTSDTFHPDVDSNWLRKMMIGPVHHCQPRFRGVDHKFLFLTKRSKRMVTFFQRYAEWTHGIGWPGDYPHVGLGVTVENQDYRTRLVDLFNIPAAMRFVSIEPQLDWVDIRPWLEHSRLHRPLDWVLLGAESGPNRRPFNTDWARYTRDHCIAAGVPFFYKQGHDEHGKVDHIPLLDGRTWTERPKWFFNPDKEGGAS